MERTEKSIEINAPVKAVFDLYSDFEKWPEWMKHIKEVRKTGENYTKWSADAPLGMNIEWEAETTAFEPNRKIAWRSVRGDVDMQGEVTFEKAGRGKTAMHVTLSYKPPAGHLGALVAKLFGNDPDKEIDEELKRFALLAEQQASKQSSSGKKESPDDTRPKTKRRAA